MPNVGCTTIESDTLLDVAVARAFVYPQVADVRLERNAHPGGQPEGRNSGDCQTCEFNVNSSQMAVFGSFWRHPDELSRASRTGHSFEISMEIAANHAYCASQQSA